MTTLAEDALDFNPDYAVPPGVTLRETMEFYGLTTADLCDLGWLDKQTVVGLLAGWIRITPGIAESLEVATAIPARLWLNLERNYRAAQCSR
jgi:plasmid maintenance system antidote protein VapI